MTALEHLRKRYTDKIAEMDGDPEILQSLQNLLDEGQLEHVAYVSGALCHLGAYNREEEQRYCCELLDAEDAEQLD